jgi:hypothetical protein
VDGDDHRIPATRCWAVGYDQSSQGLPFQQLLEANFRQN